MNSFTEKSQSGFLFLRSQSQRFYLSIAGIMGDSPKQEKNGIALLDGVRAMAILFVIVYHINLITHNGLWPKMSYPFASAIAYAGGSGVTLFFILSGFLLFMPYAKAFLFDGTWPSTITFYMRRALRILPGYYLSLFVMILWFAPEYLRPDHLKRLFLFVTLFMDSSPHTFRAVNGPYWTLAIEWQFYMIMPLLMLGIGACVRLARRFSARKRLAVVIACLVALMAYGVASRIWGAYYLAHPQETFLVPRSVTNIALFFLYGQQGKYLEDFAAGMLVCLFYIYTRRRSEADQSVRSLRALSPWLWGAGVLMLFLLAIWHFNIDQHGFNSLDFLAGYYPWISELALGLSFATCTLAILFGPPLLRGFFEFGPLRWIGLISYSLYIWHLNLLLILQRQILPQWPHFSSRSVYGMYWIWLVIAVIPACLGFYVWIEKPWMRLSDRLKKHLSSKQRVQKPARPADLEQVARDESEERVMVKEQEEVAI